MTLEIAILGSVEARVDGDPVGVPAGRQRALLALLAVRAPGRASAESAAEARGRMLRRRRRRAHYTVGSSRLRCSLIRRSVTPPVHAPGMSRLRTVHACADCGTEHPKWTGQCSGCGSWNSLVEEIHGDPANLYTTRGRSDADGRATALAGHRCAACSHSPSRRASPTRPACARGRARRRFGQRLLGGEPGGGRRGISKSTLLLQLLAWWPGRTLYVSAEESAQQVRLRAERLGAVQPDLWLAAETSLAGVVDRDGPHEPALVVVDSSQTIADPSLPSAAGSVTHGCEPPRSTWSVRPSAATSPSCSSATYKDGALAEATCPRGHIVRRRRRCSFEGDRHHALRLLRGVERRFGTTEGARSVRDDRPGSHRRAGHVKAAARRRARQPDRHRAGDGRAAVAGSSRSRRSPCRFRSPHRPAATRRVSTVVGWPCCWRCSSVAPAFVSPTRTSTHQSSEASGSTSPAPTFRWRWRWPSTRSRTSPLPGHVVVTRAKWVSAARSGRSRTSSAGLAEAVRMGFERAIVPRATPDVSGMQLEQCAHHR